MAKRTRFAGCAALVAALVAGCSTPPSPYCSVENWVIRQNAVPSYFAAYDVIYVYPALARSADRRSDASADWSPAALSKLHDFISTRTEKAFGRKVRVFAPIIHRTGDEAAVRETQEAIRFYLENYHQPERPYVLVAHPSGADCLYAALESFDGLVSPRGGFVAAYLPGLSDGLLARLAQDFDGGGGAKLYARPATVLTRA